MTARVRSIVGAAESLADSITEEAKRRAESRLRDADAEASRRLEVAQLEADALITERRQRISDLGDAVMARAERTLDELHRVEAAVDQAREVLSALQEASARLEAEKGPGGPASTTGRPGAWGAPRTDEVAERRHRTSPPAERDADGSEPGPTDHSLDLPRIVAREMAAAGSSRGTVAAHLQRALGMADPHVVLDEVFGSADIRP